MLNVYFTASTTESKLLPNYKHILKKLESIKGVKILSGKQVAYKKELKKDEGLSEEKIFEREKELIDKADVVIAEATLPSTGVGGEIVYALIKNKLVQALIFEDNEDTISPMLKGNPADNLFLEHYSKNNVHLILNNFVTHAKRVAKKKGKLIVIDGGDGSGKATQASLLIEYIKQLNIPVKYMDFPQYYSSFHGKTVAKFLRGEFGELKQVSPYLASLAYALDRASVKEEMEEFLQNGGIIIANRYATSNMAHQTARLKTEKQKKDFLKWVYELEYKVHKIPREDKVIYLYVPWKIGAELTKKKDKRRYLKGKDRDIAEKSRDHRVLAEEMYLKLSKKYPHWKKIDCVEKGKLLSIEEIHQRILAYLTF